MWESEKEGKEERKLRVLNFIGAVLDVLLMCVYLVCVFVFVCVYDCVCVCLCG